MLTELEQRANDEARHAHRELLERADARVAVDHALALIIRLTEDPDTGAWDDPTSSYARGLEAAALIRALLDERAHAQAREAVAYEDAADVLLDRGANVEDPIAVRKDILARIPADAKAALDRLMREAEERGFWAGRSCGGAKAEIDAALAAIRNGREGQ